MTRAATLLLFAVAAASAAPPRNNPAAAYALPWTDQIKWANVVSIADFTEGSPNVRFEAAQEAVLAKGSGVVFFPGDTYTFEESLLLKDGVVIRGDEPVGGKDARADSYEPSTRFEFPKYEPTFDGPGTPIRRAFKGIRLEDPGSASNCGVVNIGLNRGHIDLGDAGNSDFDAGKNRLVFGCLLRNAAVADPNVPEVEAGQLAWQRWTHRHHAAIHVRSAENLLVANNRIPESGQENFLMKGYVLKGARKGEKTVVREGVWFDYDNRPGIYANDYALGGAGGNGPDGTPETHPWGFRKGVVVRDNYIFCTGRCAISFSGDGTICSGNVIRFKPGVVRWTTTGLVPVAGSGTNDNRAVQMRGWRWTVADNDYEVHRNRVGGSSYLINDGEGLMHEDHVNSTVKDSKLLRNKGNAYLSIYKTAGIDGLLIEGNEVRTAGGIEAIYVVADRNKGKFECKNVRIVGNRTAGSGIRIAGSPAEGNVVERNRHTGAGGRIANEAGAKLTDNTGYDGGR